MRLHSLLPSIVVLSSQFNNVYASLGDDLPEFQSCVKYCEILTCNQHTKYPDITVRKHAELKANTELLNTFDKTPIPLHLTVLGWNCESNCDYQCQRLVTKERKENGQEIYQFHGKWPFIRVFGIQELFSTIFSIGNFIPNYGGFKLLWKHYQVEKRRGDSEYANLYYTYLLVSIVSMCAWFFSTIFHLKDTWDRERLDYFFAGMTVLIGLYAVCIRFFGLYKSKNEFKRRLLAGVCIFMYVFHVSYLLRDWDYTYNMEANVIIGLIQNVLWVYMSCKQFQKVRNTNLSVIECIYRPEYNWTLTPVLLVLCVLCGMSFELFDFPPIFELLDAHALWHFCTIWPVIWWYPYMIKDIEYLKAFKYK